MKAPLGQRAGPDARPAGELPAHSAVEHAGHWSWPGAVGTARFLFCGKPTTEGSPAVEGELHRSGLEIATLRQVHSQTVLEAAAGECGEGDALVSARAGLALRIVTADCVPVLLASPRTVAAIHAGWRGLAAGILAAAVRRMGGGRPLQAVIGPAIGPCCYEVGPDVAAAVAASAQSAAVILARGEGRRPHLDLRGAARLALERAGVERVLTIEACTRCDEARLWSYRRDGGGAGRNLAFVWRDR
jgi:hypothetical protein